VNDLARQAAKLIGRIEGWHEDSPLEHVIGAIEEVGTLVSHEDAVLLREVKRMRDQMNLRSTRFCEFAINTMGESRWRVRYDWGTDSQVGRGDTLTEALSSALDAAGVPKVEVP
jgi:hypothetical protein